MVRREITCVFALSVLLSGSAIAQEEAPSKPKPAGTIELVESVPVETSLDSPKIRETHVVWREMIAAAKSTISIETFYVSGPGAEGSLGRGKSRLRTVIGELRAALGRGVKLRLITDARFERFYPSLPRTLDKREGAETRRLDVSGVWGGVVHTKLMVVDDAEFFVGSQNWDWRALEHIRELGVKVRHPRLAADMRRIFEHDWQLAEPAPEPETGAEAEHEGPSMVAPGPGLPWPVRLNTPTGQPVEAVLAASPPAGLPTGIPWDEPLLVELMNGAKETLRVQVLSMKPVDREGRYYDVLDGALRRAAARGVKVQVVVANWSKDPDVVPYLKSLAALPNLEVHFSNLPEAKSGFIPYARVEHAKYAVADRDTAWIGTSNWSRGYFHESRNVSLFLRGEAISEDLISFFEKGWESEYSEPVEPGKTYEAPRIGD
ncbi:MAG: phospholipase D-like domain-containing protein [Planctomycetota bacterium]|jgi:phosphatidylserine/phosphatidylglycerophosphate/cardiolipin synthase-like enzyme